MKGASKFCHYTLGRNDLEDDFIVFGGRRLEQDFISGFDAQLVTMILRDSDLAFGGDGGDQIHAAMMTFGR